MTSQVNRDSKSFQSAKKSKEPKFVPYEPYKAAITPLVPPLKKKGSKGSIKSKTPEKTPEPEDIINTDEVDHVPKGNFEGQNQRKFNELKLKLEETEKHLRIQTQVGF